MRLCALRFLLVKGSQRGGHVGSCAPGLGGLPLGRCACAPGLGGLVGLLLNLPGDIGGLPVGRCAPGLGGLVGLLLGLPGGIGGLPLGLPGGLVGLLLPPWPREACMADD